MPELGEQMYCSQQICIPPTFPYLLRQFAKAAIRTQPNDLLKWSTTYFRCLALNIPPPVKPRLEYPIPRDHHGMTPGWLRALLYQLAGSHTVTFKTLWDRWIGACLQHPNLIQILVLAGFEEKDAIPWLRFIGMCAAHLTDNLTNTMILICEILTEEPEGGSAMISLELFIDLYQFLARIDASYPQTLRNYYFLDKFLELYQEKIAKDEGVVDEGPEEEEEFSLISSESTQKSDQGRKRDDDTSVISCPSVTSQDPDNYMKLLMKIRADGEGDELFEEDYKEPEQPPEEADDNEDADNASAAKEEEEDDADQEPKTFTDQLQADANMDVFPMICDDSMSRETKDSSGEDSVKDLGKLEDDQYLQEDLERLKAVQQELMGEDDDELEKYKVSILADAGLTPSQLEAPQHYETKVEEVSSSSTLTKSDDISSSSKSEEEEEKPKEPVDEREYEDVFVDAVPGIGPIVPESMILVVIEYMQAVAKIQHGMVMPRNIRHFECPPLELPRE